MSDFSALKRIESDGPKGRGLEIWPPMDVSNLVSGEPVQRGHLYDEDESEDYSAGVWDCTAFVDQPGPYPVDEFMLLLEGSVVMAMPDGKEITVSAGEAFVIPKGLDCQWKMPETVRKIFMILDGATPGQASNLSRERITTLSQKNLTDGSNTSETAVSTRTTHFLNHDCRMSVYTESFAAGLHGPAPSGNRQIVYVVAGRVAFSEDPDHKFSSGQTFYLSPGNRLTWRIDAGTRLLVSTCTPPST